MANLMQKIILVTLIVTSIALVAGCSTGKRVLKTEGAPSSTGEEIGLLLKLKYIDEDEIKKRFGEKNNPFIAPPSAFSLNQFIIFELTIDTQENFKGPFIVQLRDIELQFGSINKSPTNQFQLSSFWKHLLERENSYTGWSSGKIRSVVKRTIFPNKFQINRGETRNGILLFKGNFPRYGDAIVYLPILRDGAMVKNIRFDFDFVYVE